MAFKRNKSQQTYFRTTNSFIGGSVLLFWGRGLGGTTKGALHKEKLRNINLWKTSDGVKNKSNLENRIAIHFVSVE